MTLDKLLSNLPALSAAIFVAILFIQSGLDKVLNWKENLEWLTGHFSKTPLDGKVPMMLATITVMELATGALAAAGIVYFLVAGSMSVVLLSSVIGAASITALFFGQRVAKDYAGAAVLVPYFLLLLALMYLSGGARG